MNAWDQTKRQLLEEIRILRSRNAELERINHEMPGPRDAQLRPHTDRAQFQSFVQTAPSVVLCLDQEYRILEFNPEAERLFGRKRADVLGKDYLELFLPDNAREAVAADIEKVLAGVPTRGFENTVMTKDKQERILRWNVGRILDFEDKPASVVAFGQDITERKKAEESLRESEMTARAFLNATTDSGLLIDREGFIIDLNDNMVRRLGRNRKDMIGTVIYDCLPPDLAEQRKAIGFEAASTKKPVRFEDRRENSWFENSVYPIFDPKGQVARFAIFSRDITERKKAEQTLRESEERLKILFESAPDAIYLIDLKGNFVDGNKAAEEMTGYKREELIGKSYAEAGLLSPEQLPKAVAGLEMNAMGKPTGPDEFTLKRKDGSYITVEIRTFPVRIGNRTLALGIARDISARKKAEEALQQSEERLKILFESAPDAIYLNDLEGNFIDGNKAAEEMTGYKREELIGKNFAESGLLSPGQVPKVIARLEKNAMGEPMGPDEFTLTRKDGSNVTVEIRTFPVRIGNQTLSLGIARDISDRKKAEEKLATLSLVVEQSSNSIAIIDNEGIVEYANPKLFELYELSPEHFVGQNWRSFLSQQSSLREKYPEIKETVIDRKMVWRGEVSDSARSGEVAWRLATIFPIVDTEGRITRSVYMSEDITERKKAEEAVRNERDKAQKYLDVAAVMLVAIDAEERVGLINKKGCEILGYEEEEIIGKNWFDNFLPERLRKEVKTVLEKLVAGKLEHVEYFENPILTKDGDERLIAWHNTRLRDEKGDIIGTLSSGEDITERKEAEQTLITYQNDLRSLASKLTSTEEFQRRQIAADLHDNVSQTLALSVNQLRRLRKSAASGDAKILDEICQMIEKSMQNVQDLTFDLASPTLYKIGLEAAISELLNEQLRDRHGIACKFYDDKKDKPLDDNIRVLLFQAVRELLVNVIKHAKAHEVEVAIQRGNDKIQISVSDDGVGFDIQEAETSIERSGGFGLFNIRERIDYIDGSFEIDSQPGSGSRFILTARLKTKTNLSPERYDGS